MTPPPAFVLAFVVAAALAVAPGGVAAQPVPVPEAAAAARPVPSAGGTAARVATAQGLVEGVVQDGVNVYRGLPFAAAPIGALRWKAPRPAPSWSDVRKADAFGAACPQRPGLSLEGGGDPGRLDEDCLTLNVWAPRKPSPARRPVMVWLHGGAFVFGGGGVALYDGTALAARGAVVVTVNYRLGPLGFFAHPALDAEQRGGPVHANFGLLDQIAALRWVQANIAAFGGDPGSVTVFGESAGAQSVLALLASPLVRGQGLFARAIAQSPYGVPSPSRAKALAVGSGIASAVGLAGARATLAELRAVPAARLFTLDDPALSLAPGVVVGDAVVPRPLLDAFRRGDQAAVPLVIGSNSDEATVAVAFGLDPEALIRKLTVARIAVRPLYPRGIDDATLGREVVRDVVFTAFAKRIAWLHAARAPTWRYYYARVPERLRAGRPGVMHGGEISDVFGTGDTCGCLGAPLVDADRAQQQATGDRWFAFANGGVPQAGAAPVWRAESRREPRVLEFGDSGAALRDGFMRRRLDVFIGALNLVERVGSGR